MRIINTHTGRIFVDDLRKLEFLTVGDYGKENNIKANFLGLTKEIDGVANTPVDLSKKWVATISTQKGCPMKCEFCDCHAFGFHGDASVDDLCYQIETILQSEPTVKRTERFNVHFARMGEPSLNAYNVINFTICNLRELVRSYIDADTIHPVFTTMLPKHIGNCLFHSVYEWCAHVKNGEYSGEAGLQFSINSTDDAQRDRQFKGRSLSLDEIAKLAERLPEPLGRKYTLNFAVTKDTILDATKLDRMFDRRKWIVKITPIHKTHASNRNGYDTGDSYSSYNVYRQFEQPLLELGWDVIVFVPSREEDSDRITCGNALISHGGELVHND